MALAAVILSSGVHMRSMEVPDIVDVQKHALKYAHLEPNEISSWKRRARLQALMPRLQLEYAKRRRNGIDMNINDSIYVGSGGVVVGPNDGGYSYDNNSDCNFGIKAQWNLNEAIFNPDILNISSESRRLAREREDMLSRVTHEYFERERSVRKLQFLDVLLKGSKGRSKLDILKHISDVKISKKEATAQLDSLTGGWFSESIHGR